MTNTKDKKLIDDVAKAIAWTTLTDEERSECIWPDEFSDHEIEDFRQCAIAAIDLLNKICTRKTR